MFFIRPSGLLFFKGVICVLTVHHLFVFRTNPVLRCLEENVSRAGGENGTVNKHFVSGCETFILFHVCIQP